MDFITNFPLINGCINLLIIKDWFSKSVILEFILLIEIKILIKAFLRYFVRYYGWP